MILSASQGISNLLAIKINFIFKKFVKKFIEELKNCVLTNKMRKFGSLVNIYIIRR